MVGIASKTNGKLGGRPVGSTITPAQKQAAALKKLEIRTLQEFFREHKIELAEIQLGIARDRKTPASARLQAIFAAQDRDEGKTVQPELHGGIVRLEVVTGVPEPDEDYPGQHSADVPSAQLQPKTPYIQHDAEEARLSSPSSSIATAAVCEAATVGSPPIPPRPLPQAPPVTNTSQLPGDMTPAEHFMVAEQLKLKQARDAAQDAKLGLKVEWSR